MAAIFMIAIEATIVSTAMPQIAGQLGDLHLYAWVFSAFLLTQTATTVVFGKLADLYGRRPVLLAGIAVFLAGSLLCGFAWSMASLVAFRLVQGVGAGAIQPVCLTVVGDLYPGQERAKVQGWIASVWGLSSLLGPLVGALMVRHLDCAWIFWVNIPIGVAAAAGFVAFLQEDVAPTERSVDWAGAALFTVAVAALMVALTGIGTAGTGLVLASAAVCAAALALFAWQEARARDPMLDIRLWTRRSIATCNAVTACGGMALIGLTTFLPMYVQGVLGQSALVAGFTLTAMVLGWPIGATVAARLLPRLGLRRLLLGGAAMLPVGALGVVLLGPGGSPVLAGAGSFVMGLGMGFLNSSTIMLVQNSVGWSERGAATASTIFARNLGSTLGATGLGLVLTLGLAQAGGAAAGVDAEHIRQLLQDGAGTAEAGTVRAALGEALHMVFWGVFAIAALTLALATRVPRLEIPRGR
jgi:MFS family permease